METKHTWATVIIGAIIGLVYASATLHFATECRSAGGTVARGIYWWVCLK